MGQQQEFVDFEIEGLDLTGVKPMEGGQYTLVAEGSYVVDVINVKQETADTAKPYIECEYQISDEQETEAAAAFAGQHLWCRYYLTDKAKGRLANLMLAVGAPLDKFRASVIFGAKLIVDVVHNQGEAKTDADGNPMPIRTFANVCKERAFGGAQEAAPPPPPVTKAKTTAAKPAATNGAQVRRA